ncbi:MAG: NUDIX hydrolase [Pseudomonadota bacterium]
MILRAYTIDLPVLDQQNAFERANRPAIEAHWEKVVAQQPRLWNGAQFLFEDVHLTNGVLSGVGYRSDYAAFMYWRENRDEIGDQAIHIAATTLPVMADGGLLAIRMAAHTANAGAYYFPAGSLDASDVTDGRIDVDANIARELREETGIEASFCDEDYVIALDRGAWHVGRRLKLGLNLADVKTAINAHQKETGDDEIDDVVGIYSLEDAARLKPYARMLAEWFFRNEASEVAA